MKQTLRGERIEMTGELNGVYAYDRGDTCVVEQITPWSYRVVCASGRDYSTVEERILQYVRDGWFTLIRPLQPKPRIDETMRARNV